MTVIFKKERKKAHNNQKPNPPPGVTSSLPLLHHGHDFTCLFPYHKNVFLLQAALNSFQEDAKYV